MNEENHSTSNDEFISFLRALFTESEEVRLAGVHCKDSNRIFTYERKLWLANSPTGCQVLSSREMKTRRRRQHE